MIFPVNPIKSPFSYGFPLVFLWFSYGFPMVFQRLLSQLRFRIRFSSWFSPPFKATLGDMKALWREVARLQQAERCFTGCEESRMIVLKYMEIYDNLYGNHRKYMEIYGNMWKYLEIFGNIWKYMEIYMQIIGMDHYECNWNWDCFM